MSKYSYKFKEAMVTKLITGSAISAGSLSIEVGVPQSTLSRWVREYGSVGEGGNGMKKRRPQDWSAEEKMDAVLEYEKLKEEQQGQYLREKGLHTVHIEQWRQSVLAGLKKPKQNKQDPHVKRIKELEKELRRKDKALAETAALLVLKKKAQAIWGDPEDEE